MFWILIGRYVKSKLIIAEMSLIDSLTPEFKRAVEMAGDSPIRLRNLKTHRDDVLVSAEVDERLLLDQEDRSEQAAFLWASRTNAKARLMEDS